MDAILRDLMLRPVWRVGDLTKIVSRRDLERAVAREELRCPAWGIVATPEAVDHPDFDLAVQALRTRGTVHLLSAADMHGLGDLPAPPRRQWLVPASYREAPETLAVVTRRTLSPKLLECFTEEREALGVPYRVTSPARTVVDLYRVPTDPHTRREVLAAYLATGADGGTLFLVSGVFDLVLPDLDDDFAAVSAGLNVRGM